MVQSIKISDKFGFRSSQTQSREGAANNLDKNLNTAVSRLPIYHTHLSCTCISVRNHCNVLLTGTNNKMSRVSHTERRWVRSGDAGRCVGCVHQHGGPRASLLGISGGPVSNHRGVDGCVAPSPSEQVGRAPQSRYHYRVSPSALRLWLPPQDLAHPSSCCSHLHGKPPFRAHCLI